MTAQPRIERSQVLTDCRRHIEHLAAEVDATRRDAGFRATLAVISQFWRYSPANSWFIRFQRPTATRVAGRRLWEKLGRTVKPGEEPLWISAPVKASYRFIMVPVFDQGQTRGRRVPSLDLVLRGRTEKDRLLEGAAARLGIAVFNGVWRSDVAGLSRGGIIQIAEGLPPRERASVLAHELGHELLHQPAPGRPGKRRRKLDHALRETEAEAVAFVVLNALGLPSKAATYIAWQGGTGTAILASLGRVQRAARTILLAAEESVEATQSRRPTRGACAATCI
jgi:hypothetical protein